jgi:AmiR/NasT family two-component response regulator
MDAEAARLQEALLAADDDLDRAWQSGVGLDCALAAVKRLSHQVGRDPVIEDAKLQLADSFDCSPSDAFVLMVRISQNTNRKVADVARAILGADPPSTTPVDGAS